MSQVMSKYNIITLLLGVLSLYPALSFAKCNITCRATLNPPSPVNLGSFDPYNYTDIVMPAQLRITCSGTTPAHQCDSLTAWSYSYKFDGGGVGKKSRLMKIPTASIGYSVCATSSCTQTYNNSYGISNSFNFIPSVGQTDNYTIFFVVPVQPLSYIGTYTDDINTQLQY